MKSAQRRQSRGLASSRRGPLARTACGSRTDGSAAFRSQTRKSGNMIAPVMPAMPKAAANQRPVRPSSDPAWMATESPRRRIPTAIRHHDQRRARLA